jgi:hypothetical protein
MASPFVALLEPFFNEKVKHRFFNITRWRKRKEKRQIIEEQGGKRQINGREMEVKGR